MNTVPSSSMSNAVSFVASVKSSLGDAAFQSFLNVLHQFATQRCSTGDVMQHVRQLFAGNEHLIPGFNTFLPEGYSINLTEAVLLP